MKIACDAAHEESDESEWDSEWEMDGSGCFTGIGYQWLVVSFLKKKRLLTAFNVGN